MPQLQYEYLGFENEKQYDRFARHIVEIYEENDNTSTYSISDLIKRRNDYFREEFGLGVNEVSYQQIRYLLKKYGVEMRKSIKEGKPRRRTRKSYSISFDDHDADFLENLKETFGNHRMRRELFDFMMCIVRGKPTPHMIFWLDEFKPVLALYDPKTAYYTLISEDLSKLEARTLEPIMAQVEKQTSLEPLQLFCNEKGLTWWGDND